MKYIFLALKTIAAVLVVLGVACSIYAIKETQEYFDRMGEDARIRNENEYEEESFNRLCDFVENNLDELLEFSDNYISMLSPENTHIDIEAEGDMQEFRDKLFDNVYEGYAFINVDDDKYVTYLNYKAGFSEHIVVFEDENGISAEHMRALSVGKNIKNRVFVYIVREDH